METSDLSKSCTSSLTRGESILELIGGEVHLNSKDTETKQLDSDTRVKSDLSILVHNVDSTRPTDNGFDYEGNKLSQLCNGEYWNRTTKTDNIVIPIENNNSFNIIQLPSCTETLPIELPTFNIEFKTSETCNTSDASLDFTSGKHSSSSMSEGSISDISTESNPSNSKESENVDKFDVKEDVSHTSDYTIQIENYKKNILELQNSVDRLMLERARLEVEASHSACISQIDQQKREIELCKQERELDARTQATLKLEIDAMKKQYDAANKEKEASVMRYAVSEMEVLNQRKERENIDKKYKELLKEKEGLSTKLKNAVIEKARISQLLDNKCSELFNAQKDVEKLKDELNTRDIKIKWTQNKLKLEMESNKVKEEQVEKLSGKILEAEEEVEKAKRDAETSIKQFQFSQENKAYVLEQQLRELQAQLILERHNSEDKENTKKQFLHELEALKNRHALLMDENEALKLKVNSLEKERQDHEQTILQLRDSVNKSSQEVSEMCERTSAMENHIAQLKQEKEKVAQLQAELVQLRNSNEELLNDMSSCREREAEMLEFTQKVTAKNVRLQSEYSCVEAKARQLEFAEEPLQKKVEDLIKRIDSLEKELIKERLDRGEEKRIVARHLAEKTAKVEMLTREMEDLKGENQVMKHKHATTLRELNREVQQYRKRVEQFENSSGSDSLCQGSRASSCNSLNDSSPVAFEPEKQALVDRILRQQRESVRLREKIDFLEEHCRQLTVEMQKKTRVLQSYLMREEAGTLSSGSMDYHKAELTKHGGIMASVYGSKPADDGMTLELSLEINRKLQAVLEDTLLKNITLKENIDTLGDEIRRLSKKS